MKTLFNIGLMIVVISVTGCVSMLTSEKEVNPNTDTMANGTVYYLPDVTIKVTGVWNSSSGLWDLTATPVYSADWDAGVYRAERRVNAMFDDDLLVATDANGLLQTVNGSTTDQTGNSIASLAAAAATAYTFGASAAASAATSAATPRAAANPTVLSGQEKSDIARLTGNCNTPEDRINLQVLINKLQLAQSRAGLTEDEGKLLDAAVAAANWYDVTTKARFSTFETLLTPINANTDARTKAHVPSVSVPQVKQTAYVLSPMNNGQVTYATFEMTLATKAAVDKQPSFPAAFGKDGVKYHGVLVREPVPYNLVIVAHIWSTYWVPNAAGLSQIPGYLTSPANPGVAGGAGQPQQAPALSYAWTYNLATNQKYMTPKLQTEERQYTAFAQSIMLPDASHTRLVRISRRPMVTDATKLSLVNGMVQSREDVKPSGVAGWAGLPKTIVSSLVPFFSTSGSGGGQGSGGSSAGGGAQGSAGGGGGGGAGAGGGGAAGAAATGGGSGQGQQPGAAAIGGASSPISPPIQP